MNNDIKNLDDNILADITSMPIGIIKSKTNIIIDFADASETELSVGNRKNILPPELFTNDASLISVTEQGVHVNFIDNNALKIEQKQALLDQNALDLSNHNESAKLCILPQGMISRMFNKRRENAIGADIVHILGDVSGLNVKIENPSRLTHPEIDLSEQKKYPFTNRQGNTDFIFWGENNDAGHQSALKKEKHQGVISKTFDLENGDIQSNVIISPTSNAPIFYEYD
ncbi:MAG: hypothetical protein ACRBDI_05855 [Alphaproteobacteria bacterium]